MLDTSAIGTFNHPGGVPFTNQWHRIGFTLDVQATLRPFAHMHQTVISATDKHFLQSIYEAALKPTLPVHALKGFVVPEVSGKTYLFAAGKAATQTAAAVFPKLKGDVSGLAVTRQGYTQSGFHPDELKIMEASHPVPDALGLIAAKRAVEDISTLAESDLLAY